MTEAVPDAEVIVKTLADGGEGTVRALCREEELRIVIAWLLTMATNAEKTELLRTMRISLFFAMEHESKEVTEYMNVLSILH